MITNEEQESIYLSLLKKKVFLLPISIEKEEYFNTRYPGRTLEDRVASGDITPLLDVLWMMLDDPSKRIVANTKVTTWEGLVEKTLEFSEPAEKLKHFISGAKEAKAVVEAIRKMKERSQPDPVETEKKSPKENSPLTKPDSMTSLPVNTASQETKSESFQGDS